MSNLEIFMAPNVKPVENEKFVASERFVDSDGKPAEWEIACITTAEEEAIRRDCMRRVKVKKNRYTNELDNNLYISKMVARCTVYPNLNDAELQNSYGVMSAEELLKVMLTPGEYVEYCAKVQEINGYDLESRAEDVEEAKN